MKAKRRKRSLPKYLTREELQKLLKATQSEVERMIALFLYNTGVRVSELVNFRVEDIDFENKSIAIFRGKGAKDRVVNLSEEFIKELKSFIKDRTEGPLFISHWNKSFSQRGIQKMVKRMAMRAKLPYIHKITPHSLRHTHAVHALQSGVNIISIKKHLGHENIKTTMVYTEIADDLVKKDFEKHTPFNIKTPRGQRTLDDLG
jgi:site-specific recombinase XerD